MHSSSTRRYLRRAPKGQLASHVEETRNAVDEAIAESRAELAARIGDRIRGALWCSLLADALAVPTHFFPDPERVAERWGAAGVQTMESVSPTSFKQVRRARVRRRTCAWTPCASLASRHCMARMHTVSRSQTITQQWVKHDFLGLRSLSGPALLGAERVRQLKQSDAHVHQGLVKGDTSLSGHLTRFALRRVRGSRRKRAAPPGDDGADEPGDGSSEVQQRARAYAHGRKCILFLRVYHC